MIRTARNPNNLTNKFLQLRWCDVVCYSVVLHYSSVVLHYISVVLHYSSVVLHYSSVVLHYSSVV